MAIGVSGVGLIAVALTFESAILFVPGSALVLIALFVPVWMMLATRSAFLSRTLTADKVLEDQPLEATIEISHGRLGLPGATIVDPLAGGTFALRVAAAHLRPARAELRVVARFERRGRKTLGPPRLGLTDPLRLVELERKGAGAGQEILVLPRLERPRMGEIEPSLRPQFDGSARSAETFAALEVDGLQPYRYGTPASRIHWPALARGGDLLERRLEAESGVGPLVVLDARCQAPGELLDQAVRAAASLAHFLARRGGCELLLPGERRPVKLDPDLGAWPSAHARLAVVTGGPDAPAPALVRRPGRVLYVAAGLRPDARRTAASPFAGATLVLPSALAVRLRRRAIFEVAGCVGLAPVATRRTTGLGERTAA